MKLLLLMVVALGMVASTNSEHMAQETQLAWLTAVEESLDEPSLCRELPKLLEAPERDFEVAMILMQIVESKCKECE